MTASKPIHKIRSFRLNGLSGRMMETLSTEKEPSSHKILFLYGSQALLERYKSITENLSEYGTVITPDLPGLGGMDSFYKIGMKPTLDNYADYVAAVIAYKFKNHEKFTIVGFSFGSQIATNLLQRYPDIASRIALPVSLFGLVDSKSIKFAKHTRVLLKPMFSLLSTKTVSSLASLVVYSPVFNFLIRRIRDKQLREFSDIKAEPKMIKPIVDMELKMWRVNDIRTTGFTWNIFAKYKAPETKVNLKLIHIFAPADKYVDQVALSRKFEEIYTKGVESHEAQVYKHSPHVTATKSEVYDIFHTEVRRLLAKQSKSLRPVKLTKKGQELAKAKVKK
jgi:pimeloyl-ACP methyl ester carboxylesterase